MQGGFLVLDFGSQFTQLIARRLREVGVYSELIPFDKDIEYIKSKKPAGIILSGGPHSVYDEDSPKLDVRPLLEIAPVLGICYGMQLLTQQLGGKVHKAEKREYGLNTVTWNNQLANVGKTQKVWMSHGDIVDAVPEDTEIVAYSESDHPAALKNHRFWALQFHPEVAHTEKGTDLLEAFVVEMCGAEKSWQAPSMLEHLKEQLQNQLGDEEHVLCALSGGVDSTVAGTLLTRVFGAERVHCVFINNGLLRKNEYEQVLEIYKTIGLNVKGIDASEEFLTRLEGVSDPEKKRKIIGHTFIDVFKKYIDEEKSHITHLAQGTLYPDVIESVSLRGSSVTIKSHHNVGGLPKDLNLKLVEPFRELFKDEVRAIGKELEIPHDILWRHPFPGPGLSIRVLGEITREALDIMKDADAIFIEELKSNNLYDKIWQAFCVLLPVRTVGVQGDHRTYERVLTLRAVTSSDGMTADWFEFPYDFLKKVSNRITNEVAGVNRVVYDITSKPPGTIEWE